MFRAVAKVLLLAAALALPTLPASAEMVWNRGNSGDPETLDPHKTSTSAEANILRDLFEGLVMQDAGANLIPGVAESWTISPDGTVYTFKLRADAVWSNGDPVTADDFVYSFRRMQDPATAAEYAAMLYVVKNAEAVNAGKAKPEALGVKAIDRNTFEITLAQPTPYFLEMLTHQATYPVNRASIEKLGADWVKPGNLVSNGAFTLAEFVPNDHIRLVKNPKFHDAANVKLDAVNFFPTEDRSTAAKRFEAGELDSNDDLPTEQLADLRAKFGDQVKTGPFLGTYYYAVKWDKPPWNDVKLRRAISMAIDRDFLAEKVWGNTMIPAYSMVPPGIAGYTPAMADYAAMAQIDREDEAKKLLAELGYGPDHPLKLEIRYNTSENHKNTAIAIQEELRPLGIEVSMVNADAKTHFAYLQQKGDFDYARSAWVADYKDPESFLGISRKGNAKNYSNYDGPDFDSLMEKAAAAGGNPAERFKLLSAAEALLMRDTANMPLLYYGYHDLVSARLRGWQANVMEVHPSRFVSKE